VRVCVTCFSFFTDRLGAPPIGSETRRAQTWPSSTRQGVYREIYVYLFIFIFICVYMYICIYIIFDRIGDAAGADVAIVDPRRYVYIYI